MLINHEFRLILRYTKYDLFTVHLIYIYSFYTLYHPNVYRINLV